MDFTFKNILKKGTKLQNGRYVIDNVLGQGGFGITYLAEQTFLCRKVAIKEFFMNEYCNRDATTSQISVGSEGGVGVVDRFRKKFIKEAQNLAKLKHKSIVSVIDIFEENGTAYYVMEYVSGGSLADKVNDGPIPEPEAVRYISQAASALELVHSKHMMHLDIKPGNILIDKDDNAVVIDFGLSKQYDNEGHQTSTTPVGISHGYAPIEQYRRGGVSSFSPAADIYSLGATLYKLVTGDTPPEAGDIINDGLPELPVCLSLHVRRTIEAAMQPATKNRPQNIGEFMKLLESGASNADNDSALSDASAAARVASKSDKRDTDNDSTQFEASVAAGVVSKSDKRDTDNDTTQFEASAVAGGTSKSDKRKIDNDSTQFDASSYGAQKSGAEAVREMIDKRRAEEAAYSSKSKFPVVILIILLFLGIGAAAFFLFSDNSDTDDYYYNNNDTGYDDGHNNMPEEPAFDYEGGTAEGTDVAESDDVAAGAAESYDVATDVVESYGVAADDAESYGVAADAVKGVVSTETVVETNITDSQVAEPVTVYQDPKPDPKPEPKPNPKPEPKPEPKPAKPTKGRANGHEYVDLGLSVRWATCNVGASAPEHSGYYYAWGETTTKMDYSDANSVTNNEQMGSIAGDYAYDVASYSWGGGWRMPTRKEFEELRYNCRWEWTSQGGVSGYRVTSKKNGESIFLPATGWRHGAALSHAGEQGYYWTSTPYEGDTHNSYNFMLDMNGYDVYFVKRRNGQTIRPVCK